MKEESEKTYTYYRKAQYHETDQMGIIHHSNYVKWMEEASIMEFLWNLIMNFLMRAEMKSAQPLIPDIVF